MIPIRCISYSKNLCSFPQPLSMEEEKHYLKLLESGDQAAKDILIERNLRLVAHIVKKYTNTNHDIDDLISIGTIGLIKGITSFDSSKCTRLATYAARCIENPMQRQRQHLSLKIREVYLINYLNPVLAKRLNTIGLLLTYHKKNLLKKVDLVEQLLHELKTILIILVLKRVIK